MSNSNLLLTNSNEFEQRLNSALGEDDVEWLWVEEYTKQRVVKPSFAWILVSLTFVLLGIWSYSLMGIGISALVGYLGLYLRRKKKAISRYLYGVSPNRVVAIRKDGQELEQLMIPSICSNTIQTDEGQETNRLVIATTRKKIEIPNLTMCEEVQDLLNNLQANYKV
ncbi:MAG: hypothetical protein GY810_02115 [Aureispira sp.]|nr:hypothetical protein [Aureispira sp.]